MAEILLELRKIMREAILTIVIVGGVLAAPILCAAGVAEHECVCDPVECCDEEMSCGLDPCDDAYQREEWRKQDMVTFTVSTLVLFDAQDPAAGQSPGARRSHPGVRALPFPESDLPLRI